jgi:hypothetical protein
MKGETIAKWKTFSKLWSCYYEYNTRIQTQECNQNQVFANCSGEEEIFFLPHKKLMMLKEQIANSRIA